MPIDVLDFRPDADRFGPEPVAPALPVAPAGDVEFVEVWPGSPEMSFKDDGSEVIREFRVPWDKYFESVREMLGYPVIAQAGNLYYLRRKNPIYYPECVASQHPTLDFALLNDIPRPFLYATSIRKLGGEALPHDSITKSQLGVGRYRVARAAVLYETLTYEIREDAEVVNPDYFELPDESGWQRYVTVVPAPQGSYLTLPAGSFVAAGYSDPVPGTPGKIVPEADLSVTWHRVPTLAVGLRSINPYITTADGYVAPIEYCLGRVNDRDFNGFRKGTLLLCAAVIKPIRSAIGHRLFDVEYRFKWLPVQSRDTQSGVGWNGSTYAYGHNLLLLVNSNGSMGYYEVVHGTVIGRKGNVTTGQATVTGLSQTKDLSVGLSVTGQHIPANTTIQAVNSPTQITLNNNATGTGETDLTFSNNATSNARKDIPADGKNIYDWADFRQLFRVPLLGI